MVLRSPLRFCAFHRVPVLPRMSVRELLGDDANDLRAPWFGAHFRATFLDTKDKAAEATALREHEITLPTRDLDTQTTYGVLRELGGLSWTPITLGQFRHVLLGSSRLHGYMTYVRRGEDVFAVHAHWAPKGKQTLIRCLYIESADPTARASDLAVGCHVISH